MSPATAPAMVNRRPDRRRSPWHKAIAGATNHVTRPLVPRPGRRALGADDCGVVALEFAIVAPVFLFLLFSVFGVGLGAFYQQSLDDSVRDAARQVQMKTSAATSGAGFVSAICAEFGILALNCSTTLSYSVSAGTAAGGFLSLTPQSLSSSGAFNDSFFSGNPLGPKIPVLLQVAYPLPFTLPYVGRMITFTGTNSIVATAAVMIEPYQ